MINARRLLLLMSSCALSACATTRDYYSPATSETDQQLVERAWPYAQLAYNSYRRETIDPDARPFVMPREFISVGSRYGNDEIGLAFETVVRTAPQRELIFVFRGTEGGPSAKNCDWARGNFAFYQQRRAARIIANLINKYSDHQLVFVGHSLGGAIATHLSFRHPGSRTYIFNPSPMFRADGVVGDPRVDWRRRLSVVNRFEFLYAARGPMREATQIYLPVNCGGGINPVTRHSMFRLATCLTRKAAVEGGDQSDMSRAAQQSYAINAAQFAPLRMKIDPTNPTQLCPKGRPIAQMP